MTEVDRRVEVESKIEMPFSAFPEEGVLEKLFPEWKLIPVQEGNGKWMLSKDFVDGEVSIGIDKIHEDNQNIAITKVRKNESSQITDRQSYTVWNPGFVELTFNEEDPGKNQLKVKKTEEPHNRVEINNDGRLLICIKDSEILFVGYDL